MTGRTGVRLAVRELLTISRWVLLAAAVLPVLAAAVVFGFEAATWLNRDRATGLDTSVWQFASGPARWVMLATGIMTATTVVPILIAHGITRRAAARATITVAALFATAAGLYLTLGYQIERAGYAAAGATQQLVSTHLFGSPTQLPLVFTEYAVAFAGWLAAGWLAGTVYYRSGPWVGTLCLPLTVALPLATVEAALTTRLWFAEPGLVILPTAAAVGIAVAAVTATLLAAATLTRYVPVRSR